MVIERWKELHSFTLKIPKLGSLSQLLNVNEFNIGSYILYSKLSSATSSNPKPKKEKPTSENFACHHNLGSYIRCRFKIFKGTNHNNNKILAQVDNDNSLHDR
jgi:hypothetical protein